MAILNKITILGTTESSQDRGMTTTQVLAKSDVEQSLSYAQETHSIDVSTTKQLSAKGMITNSITGVNGQTIKLEDVSKITSSQGSEHPYGTVLNGVLNLGPVEFASFEISFVNAGKLNNTSKVLMRNFKAGEKGQGWFLPENDLTFRTGEEYWTNNPYGSSRSYTLETVLGETTEESVLRMVALINADVDRITDATADALGVVLTQRVASSSEIHLTYDQSFDNAGQPMSNSSATLSPGIEDRIRPTNPLATITTGNGFSETTVQGTISQTTTTV